MAKEGHEVRSYPRVLRDVGLVKVGVPSFLRRAAWSGISDRTNSEGTSEPSVGSDWATPFSGSL